MNATRFDRITRSLSGGSSRRVALLRLAVIALGLTPSHVPGIARAKKGKKKFKLNQFGCVNVGGKCRGKDVVCCSGICQGKMPRKGKKDKSRCVAHDVGTCQAGQTFAGCGTFVPCTTSAAVAGACFTTTGNAGYCSAITNCFPCQRDADCELYCGPQAACVTCPDCLLDGGTACAGTNYTSCSFPPT